MKAHLTEEQLLDRRFELVPEETAREIDSHLSGCADCRALNEKIARKFASLDLLRDEVPAPQALVQSVVDRVRRDQSSGIRFRRRVFIGAIAAAAAVVAVLFLPPMLRKGIVPADGGAGVQVASQKEAAMLRATDPFLPGSNIELNVLPRRDKVQVTIYNSADLTLVREQRNLTLKRGWNWLQFMWANTLIDPTSLRLEPLEYKDKIEVQALVFPPRIRELGRWLIFSEVSGQVPVEITYFTSGLSWRAFYMGTLSTDEKTMRIQGYVRAENKSGEDYENAQTRLIVGKVNILDEIAVLAKLQQAYGRPGESPDAWESNLRGKKEIVNEAFCDKPDDDGPAQITKEGLSEYFLYTIEGTQTMPDGCGKRLPSFDTAGIPVESLYKYDEEQYGAEPVRFIAFANDEKHNLGETPIPDGLFKIYRELAEDRHLNYIGESDARYIPVGEKVELNLGAARQVKVEPKLMDFKTANHTYNQHGDIDGWDEIRTWRVEISNARDLPIKIRITRGFETSYWKMDADNTTGYEKHDTTHARFTVTLEPRTKKTVNYTVTTFHGKREAEAGK